MPIFQYRFGDGIQKAKLHRRRGIAGSLLGNGGDPWPRGADYYAVPWRGKWATELGGALLTHAIHLHDMLCYLMGDVASRLRPTPRPASTPSRSRTAPSPPCA